MNLLIITRKINNSDKQVGFVTDWILEFAKKVENLYVICQELGEISNLPNNIKIYSLGKEKGYNKFHQLYTFYSIFFSLIKKIDGVFSHMIQHYSILTGFWCKLFNKKLFQWYAHHSEPFTLKISSLFVNAFITSSSAGFPYKTKKTVHCLGQGINTNKFKSSNLKNQNNKDKFTILTVGRISPTKNIDLLIKTAEQISLNEPDLRDKILFQIIGAPGLKSQQKYYLDLINEVKEKNLNSVVDFLGPLPQEDILDYYQKCDLFINLSDTGSLDKTVLEAMACEKLVLTSNEAFKNILPTKLFLADKNIDEIISRIKNIYNLSDDKKQTAGQLLRKIVVDNHNLEKLVGKIISLYKKT